LSIHLVGCDKLIKRETSKINLELITGENYCFAALLIAIEITFPFILLSLGDISNEVRFWKCKYYSIFHLLFPRIKALTTQQVKVNLERCQGGATRESKWIGEPQRINNLSLFLVSAYLPWIRTKNTHGRCILMRKLHSNCNLPRLTNGAILLFKHLGV